MVGEKESKQSMNFRSDVLVNSSYPNGYPAARNQNWLSIDASISSGHPNC